MEMERWREGAAGEGDSEAVAKGGRGKEGL